VGQTAVSVAHQIAIKPRSKQIYNRLKESCWIWCGGFLGQSVHNMTISWPMVC